MEVLALIGVPGSGKTSVGAEVARLLDCPFVDVAEQMGGPDALVFLGDGEAKRAAQERASTVTSGVIAMPSWSLSGPRGATVVYLHANAAESYARSGLNRPGPAGLINPRSLWAQMLRERDPQYREHADLVIEVGTRSVAQVADELVAHLG